MSKLYAVRSSRGATFDVGPLEPAAMKESRRLVDRQLFFLEAAIREALESGQRIEVTVHHTFDGRECSCDFGTDAIVVEAHSSPSERAR